MLAIVIPYYKITFFEFTLQSLANQTDKRFKVYIGDDASLHNPSALLEKYQGKFEFMYHRFEENLGSISLVKQWERCIALTQNEDWLMILGDDDVLGETVVASWHENYELFNEKSKVIRFASIMIIEETQKFTEIYTHPIWEKATDAFMRKFRNTTRSSLSEYIFSRSTYNKYGFYNYPLAWNSDDRAWLDFSDNKPIYTINESVVFFRLSGYNISGKQDNIDVKNLSVIKFYKYLLLTKLKYYKKHEKLRFIRTYENAIKNSRNINLLEWFFLLYFNLIIFEYIPFKKFAKRCLKSLLNINES